ncbi:hypothetical protein E2C01_088719 [Portunus trituberculatus]|uniref:Uncharacterized protein n=1 Tax=Portunus trituberculatus TaxID=210409 RepID=A0A5B7JG74_PORTR|nr:hypothetical protein [Portunus trituberculatus]
MRGKCNLTHKKNRLLMIFRKSLPPAASTRSLHTSTPPHTIHQYLVSPPHHTHHLPSSKQ